MHRCANITYRVVNCVREDRKLIINQYFQIAWRILRNCHKYFVLYTWLEQLNCIMVYVDMNIYIFSFYCNTKAYLDKYKLRSSTNNIIQLNTET